MAKKQRRQVAASQEQPRAAYSIAEFCQAHGISISLFYELRKRGEGPRAFKAGRRRWLISQEAAAEWRRAREQG